MIERSSITENDLKELGTKSWNWWKSHLYPTDNTFLFNFKWSKSIKFVVEKKNKCWGDTNGMNHWIIEINESNWLQLTKTLGCVQYWITQNNSVLNLLKAFWNCIDYLKLRHKLERRHWAWTFQQEHWVYKVRCMHIAKCFSNGWKSKQKCLEKYLPAN